MSDRNAVLLDPVADAQLRRYGFVVVPFVSPDLAAAARASYGELSGWSGDGFVSDLVASDREYRSVANARLSELFDSYASALFSGYTPYLRSFLVKYPGEHSDLYVHQDWMYVDERLGHRTYTVWIALEDIDTHNGQLQVLRGSHELRLGVRGSDLIAPWLRHESAIRKRLLTVPVKAGDAVIFDNSLVHCSYPNNTDVPRVAAAVGLRPTGAPLVHFRRDDDQTASRYDVDEAFFVRFTPQGLLEAPPFPTAAETFQLEMPDYSEHELCHALDTDSMARVTVIKRTLLDERDHAVAVLRSTRLRAQERTQLWNAKIRETWKNRGNRAGAGAESTGGELGSGPTPADGPFGSAKDAVSRFRSEAPTKVAIAVLAANEWLIDTFGPKHEAVWDPDEFEWAAAIEGEFPAIRAEVEALLAGPTEIPHIEDVTGGIPQGNVGPWRSFVMMHQGKWIDWNCERVPRTTELVRDIPGLTLAGFSVLEPGTHITVHRGPNKGALRYQLGVIVPGADGDCRIRVGDEMLIWRDGEGVMFDFTIPHEAWNDSDSTRVLLMLEVITPLPWYLAPINRAAQHAMGWFPTTRDLVRRLRELEPNLSK